jgi:protein phosphatase-4 regulatory subunit 3
MLFFSQRFKYWVIHNDLIPNVIEISKDNDKILDLHIIKFVKSIINNNDENLIKILISNNCFKKIIDIFEKNREKRNLVFSATLDLFDYISKNTIKKIILHLVI